MKTVKVLMTPEQVGQALGEFIFNNRRALGAPTLSVPFGLSWRHAGGRVGDVTVYIGDALSNGQTHFPEDAKQSTDATVPDLVERPPSESESGVSRKPNETDTNEEPK